MNNFEDTIGSLDNNMKEILGLFQDIGVKSEQDIEDLYFKKVGEFSAFLNQLLEIYFDNPRDLQLKFKPDILYYRQVQGYLVFLLRYPTILKVKDHTEIKQTRLFLENKQELLDKIYYALANHETQLFEGDFREKLEKMMETRTKIYRVDN